MKTKQALILSVSLNFLLFLACTKDNQDEKAVPKSYLDTLIVPHSIKGYELYSWSEGNDWHFSVLVGTNRTKTYLEVISNSPSEIHLVTVTGTNNLKLVLARFPEKEFITWIGQGWLQSCWGSNYGNLQLPPQNYIDDITQYCIQKKLIVQVLD
jgi:hypothetical protein